MAFNAFPFPALNTQHRVAHFDYTFAFNTYIQSGRSEMRRRAAKNHLCNINVLAATFHVLHI